MSEPDEIQDKSERPQAVVDNKKKPWPLAWLPAAGLGIPALVLFWKLGGSGIWDPYELNVADLARRIAVNVLGAKSLMLTSGDNSMPTLGDLGRGELPFTSIAVGFSMFGLHEWSGRLPLALWGMAGVGALYWWLKRLVDARAAAYSAIVLATMPLYFVQARTMLGDIVTMASLAIAFAGLSVCIFDKRAATWLRGLGLTIGCIGLLGGYLARGAIIGLAVPLLTLGLVWLLIAVNRRRSPQADRFSQAVSIVALAAGAVLAARGAWSLFTVEGAQISPMVGASIAPPSKMPTFDFVILYLGHSLFPWSAFVPFAAGRLFRAPAGIDEDENERLLAVRTTVLVGSALCFGAFAMMAPRTGYIPFAGVALLAAIAGLAIRDYETGAPSSRALGLGVVTFLMLFYRDFDQWPEKGLSAYGVTANFPDTFKSSASRLILGAAILFAVLVFASWLERDKQGQKFFDFKEYRSFPDTVRTANSGNLMFVLVVVEAALIGFAALVWIGMKLHWKQVVTMSANIRVFAINAWWIAPIAIVALVYAAYSFRDVCRVVFPAARLSRASATLLGGALAGSLLAFSYYPRLSSQLSPKEVFDSYGRMHKDGERLSLLGVSSRTAMYYSGGDVQTFGDVDTAFRWLMEGQDRRWLGVRMDDLAKLNSVYRGKARPMANLPVLDGHSGQIVLASNRLLPGEVNENPLNNIILPEKPNPSHPLDTDLQGELLALGWDVVDLASRKPVQYVVAGKKYRMRTYFQVTGRISGEWEMFIHIDGHQRRFNGDHKPMDSKYPMSLWQVGDYVVDDYEFALEPNFTPGPYMLYYGFFIGDSRLKVVRGKHHEDRIEGGNLMVQ
ncbi:MAG: glycosyltransferase family 39 protein [Deltaproteobacteria bacterium]|nr:glycosyltransferase family 39 protein [Deltaproteobacteria bacterium]